MRNKKPPIVEHGITITKPWSTEMYDHNNKVADQMKAVILKAIHTAYGKNDEQELRVICKSLCAYSHSSGYSIDEIYAYAHRELDLVQNYWLQEACWSHLVELRIVDPIYIGFVGYTEK